MSSQQKNKWATFFILFWEACTSRPEKLLSFLYVMLSLIYLTNIQNIQKLQLLIQDNLGFLLAKLK